MAKATRKRWERLEGETDKAFAAFEAFLLAGEARTVAGTYRAVYGRDAGVDPPGWFREWAGRFDWRSRAAAYDDALLEEERHAISAERKKLAVQQERWRLKQARDDYELAESLRDLARDLLADLKPEVRPDGKRGRVPVELKPADVAKVAETASKLGRMAAAVEAVAPSSLSGEAEADGEAVRSDVMERTPEEIAARWKDLV